MPGYVRIQTADGQLIYSFPYAVRRWGGGRLPIHVISSNSNSLADSRRGNTNPSSIETQLYRIFANTRCFAAVVHCHQHRTCSLTIPTQAWKIASAGSTYIRSRRLALSLPLGFFSASSPCSFLLLQLRTGTCIFGRTLRRKPQSWVSLSSKDCRWMG